MGVREVPCDESLQRKGISEEEAVTNGVVFKPLDRLVWLWCFLSSSSCREGRGGGLWLDQGGLSIVLSGVWLCVSREGEGIHLPCRVRSVWETDMIPCMSGCDKGRFLGMESG